ncbi:MAG: ABC transporter permease [Chloroflexota bacterium]|nr:ABC transporter permease [Chloroflexota bacterium]
MRNTLAIAGRELQTYFVSPIAYVVAATFLAISGYLFAAILLLSREATLLYLFSNLTTILLFVTPLLTMRLLAEEQKSGTLELLLTSPVQDWEVVLGKWLASLGLFAAIILLTGYYPLILWRYGNPDWGPVLSGYVGLLLLGGAMLALGTLASALTSNQIVAAVLGVGLIVLAWLVDALSQFVGPPLAGVLTYLSLGTHFFDFLRGIVDTKDIVYYLSVIVLALFLSTRVLETRRWR